MKKVLSILTAIAAGIAFADDSYLYWMVDTTANYYTSVKSTDWSYARVAAYDSSGTLAGYLSPIAQSVVDASLDYDGVSLSSAIANPSSFLGSGYSYYVELVNSGEGGTYDIVSRSEKSTYNDVIKYVGTSSTLPVTYASVPGWNPGGGGAVPEPSSGLLMLIGGALLGLRRRRREVVRKGAE